MSEGYLRCRGVTKGFGQVTAVVGLDLDLARGQVLALLGPSGCGKTTLLRLIAGFERPDVGSIELGGRLLATHRESLAPEKRRVGLVFQDYALFPHLSVERNIGFGVPGGVDRRTRVAEMLELVGLSGLGKRMPHELSGGQQQRVALARSLAAQPELVLLDEPFSNLDPAMRVRVRSEVWQILKSLGTTAIIVTHDQEEALSLPGEVAVMLDGRIRQTGSAADIYRRPVDRQVAAFVGDANFLSGTASGSTAECELGVVATSAPAEGKVELMLRPEDLVLCREGGGVRVRVTGTEYYGHDQVIIARLPSEVEIRVRVVQGARLLPGDEIGVRPAGEAIAYPARV
jgi:iron(III) transport system ATP-binding protein